MSYKGFKDPTILDLCGGTGAWSRPWQDAGFNVVVVTLPKYDVQWKGFGNYAMEFFRQDVHWRESRTVLYEDVYGILAAPPCTEFSVAKNGQSRDLGKVMELVQACLRIIWETQKHTKLAFWALENPRGLLRRFLGRPYYTFEQWQYGEQTVKPTDVWGWFNKPAPTVKVKPECPTTRFPNGRANARDWGKVNYPNEYSEYMNKLDGYDAKRAAARAITPAGFAEAFYKANKPREKRK